MISVATNVQNQIYELYRIKWMADHGVTFTEVADLAEEWRQILIEGQIDPAMDEGFDFESFIEERGFGEGSLWVCFDEFMQAEYQDAEYIKELVSCRPDLLDAYLKEIADADNN